MPAQVVHAVAATGPSATASGLTTTWNAPWHSAAASTTSAAAPPPTPSETATRAAPENATAIPTQRRPTRSRSRTAAPITLKTGAVAMSRLAVPAGTVRSPVMSRPW